MSRKLPSLPPEIIQEIERAWSKKQTDWARSRLLVVRLIALQNHETEEIALIAGVSRKTVFNYRDAVLSGGVRGLLTRRHAGGRTALVRDTLAEKFIVDRTEGQIVRAKDAQAWILQHTHRRVSLSGAWKTMKRIAAIKLEKQG